MSRPLVIAHRGASGYEVENSLAAFRAAGKLGADAVELDIHETADGAFVVHHGNMVGPHHISHCPLWQLREHYLANGEPLEKEELALSGVGLDEGGRTRLGHDAGAPGHHRGEIVQGPVSDDARRARDHPVNAAQDLAGGAEEVRAANVAGRDRPPTFAVLAVAGLHHGLDPVRLAGEAIRERD